VGVKVPLPVLSFLRLTAFYTVGTHGMQEVAGSIPVASTEKPWSEGVRGPSTRLAVSSCKRIVNVD
jgi:hypothetical protein